MANEPLQPAPDTEHARKNDELSDTEGIQDSLDRVSHSFLWLNDAAQQRLGRLQADLQKTDEPPWYEPVLMGLVEVALGGGAAGAAEFLAGKVARTIMVGVEEHVAEAGQELIKAMFEEGIGKGIEAGHHTLAAHHGSGNLELFIEAQKDAVRKVHQENEIQFLHHGRHQVKTRAQARSMEEACTAENVTAAADRHYAATRDAWVSYLAQARFGAVSVKNQTVVQPGDVNVGATTTLMSSAESRAKTNAWAPGFVPEAAPDLYGAVLGHVPGVMEVAVTLPDIQDNRLQGTPRVDLAILGGVNGEIRGQYKNTALADIHLPRQIHARVQGDRPDFTISLDERGEGGFVPNKQAGWLRARSLVGDHPENATKDDASEMRAGIALLLRDLVAEEIL